MMKDEGKCALKDFPREIGPDFAFVHQDSEEDLVTALAAFGFQVYIIEGSRVQDAPAFLREAVRAFQFEDVGDYRWEDFTAEVSGLHRRGERQAIVWRHLDLSARQDIRTTLEALFWMRTYAREIRDFSTVAIFLLAEGEKFCPFVWSQGPPE